MSCFFLSTSSHFQNNQSSHQITLQCSRQVLGKQKSVSVDPTCGQELYLVHLVNGQYRIKLSKDPSVPSIALQTSFLCPQYLTVVLQLISQRNEFCAVLLCTFIHPPPKGLGNCWPISNKFSSKASTCATSKLFENNINKSSSLPGCRSLDTHQRTHRGCAARGAKSLGRR